MVNKIEGLRPGGKRWEQDAVLELEPTLNPDKAWQEEPRLWNTISLHLPNLTDEEVALVVSIAAAHLEDVEHEQFLNSPAGDE